MSNAVDYSNWKKECVDGKIYYMSPSTNYRHGEIIFKIARRFGNYLEGKKCKVFVDNIDVWFDENSDEYVIPDVSILCDPTKFKGSKYIGIPTLIVEVISPTSVIRDRGLKFNLYEKWKVPEYWLVDYINRRIEQYVLQDEKYILTQAVSVIDIEDIDPHQEYTTKLIPATFPEFEIDVVDIFE